MIFIVLSLSLALFYLMIFTHIAKLHLTFVNFEDSFDISIKSNIFLPVK